MHTNGKSTPLEEGDATVVRVSLMYMGTLSGCPTESCLATTYTHGGGIHCIIIMCVENDDAPQQTHTFRTGIWGRARSDDGKTCLKISVWQLNRRPSRKHPGRMACSIIRFYRNRILLLYTCLYYCYHRKERRRNEIRHTEVCAANFPNKTRVDDRPGEINKQQ